MLRSLPLPLGALALCVAMSALTLPLAAAPPIRVTAANTVPACVTPERLTAYLETRNPAPRAAFRDIAHWYQRHGEAYRVRWDYAFFQMLLETNFLRFHRPDGRPGDVSPAQNNFAGLGATGGGVPGDRFPDTATGVRAQIEHLVVYSGDRLAAPTAPRTALKQDDILAASARLGRPVTFADLAGRWAADRRYGQSIETLAEEFRSLHCRGPQRPEVAQEHVQAKWRPVRRENVLKNKTLERRPDSIGSEQALGPAPRSARPAEARRPPRGSERVAALSPAPAPARPCRVLQASFGGTRTLLLRHEAEAETQMIALQVVTGFERSMADRFIAARAPGAVTLATYESRDAAVAEAFGICGGRG